MDPVQDGTNESTVNDSQDSNESQENQNSKYVTTDQLNRAITGHNKRLERAVMAEVSSLKELFSSFGNKSEDSDQTTNSSNNQNSHTTSDKPSPELLRLQKQIEDLNKLVEVERRGKEEESKKAREEKVRSEVLKVLSENKVEKSEQVYRLVKDQLQLDDSGNVKLRLFDSTIGLEEDKDLRSGLSEWLNTDGLHFLPPRNTSGSGATSSSNNNNRSGGRRTYSMQELNDMKPSDLAKTDLQTILKEQGLMT